MTITLLIAGGVGARIGQDIPKQFMDVLGKPVIAYTMERFQSCSLIDGIVIVTLKDWIGKVWEFAERYGISKLRDVVAGGATGHESIHNGIVAIAKSFPPDTAVMIHDAVRPMVNDAIIADNLAVYHEKGNATTVTACAEVLFQSDLPMELNRHIDRSTVWRTQTPQTFRLDNLLRAHKEAVVRDLPSPLATCHLFSMLGEKVYFSKGGERNLKLTTTDDVAIFKAMLSMDAN